MIDSLQSQSQSTITIREWISRHPLLSFIALAYASSWIAWLIMYRIGLGLFTGFSMIGTMGPSLSAMIISAIQRPEPSGVSIAKRWKLFGLVALGILAVLFMRRLWLTTGLTTVFVRVVARQVYPSLAVFLLDVMAAAGAALVFSGIHSPRQGVCDLLHSLNLRHLRPGWCWYIIAVGLYPAVILLGNVISAGLGLPVKEPNAAGAWYLLAPDVMLAFSVTLFGGGGLEEPGWRGFALPLLLKRYSPLRSSLILAPIWAFWHWPLFWFGVYGGGPLGVFFYVLGVAPIAILMTAIFNWTRGSLPIVILLHTSINTTSTFLPVTMIGSGLWWLLAFGAAFWMWRSPKKFNAKDLVELP